MGGASRSQLRHDPRGHAAFEGVVALAASRASFRGRELPGAPALDPAGIRQVGLVIAARQAGAFARDLRRISLA